MIKPNAEQVKGVIRALIPLAAGLLGYSISSDQAAVIAASITAVATAIWSLVDHTESATVRAVGSMAEDPNSLVRGAILKPSPAGVSLDKVTPPTVVVAGSSNAKHTWRARRWCDVSWQYAVPAPILSTSLFLLLSPWSEDWPY